MLSFLVCKIFLTLLNAKIIVLFFKIYIITWFDSIMVTGVQHGRQVHYPTCIMKSKYGHYTLVYLVNEGDVVCNVLDEAI